MKRFLFLFFLFLILQLVFPHKARARVLFIDSFDDGEADNWDIDYLTPQKDDSRWDDSKWEVNTDGEYGITFHDHQMRTISSIGDPDWSNYIYGLLLDGKSKAAGWENLFSTFSTSRGEKEVIIFKRSWALARLSSISSTDKTRGEFSALERR